MAQLTITFSNLAVFAHSSNCLIVLIPDQGHTAQLSGDGLTEPFDLNGHHIHLTRNGWPLKGQVSSPADDTYLVDITPLGGGWTVPNPSDPNSPPLIGRFALGGGSRATLIAPRSQVSPAADVHWQFGNFVHKLTDTVQFVLDLDSGTDYGLYIE